MGQQKAKVICQGLRLGSAVPAPHVAPKPHPRGRSPGTRTCGVHAEKQRFPKASPKPANPKSNGNKNQSHTHISKQKQPRQPPRSHNEPSTKRSGPRDPRAPSSPPGCLFLASPAGRRCPSLGKEVGGYQHFGHVDPGTRLAVHHRWPTRGLEVIRVNVPEEGAGSSTQAGRNRS